jgi:hypothetical protein
MVAATNATETQRAIGQLVAGAFFFAMRSCEFSDAGGSRRTKTITMADVEFRRDGRKVVSDDAAELATADTVSITFRTQKNGEKGTTVTQHRTDGTTLGGVSLCPVTSFAELVARIKRYEPVESEWREKDDRPINLITIDGRSSTVTASQILQHLRAAALRYGEDKLGFPIAKIGTHSIRAGAATAMFLAGVPAETIQLIGRWRSQTFLRYIRIQVQQLTRGVAKDMTANPEFLTIGQDGRGRRKLAFLEEKPEDKGQRGQEFY